MATLDSSFESNLREAMLDQIEHELVGKRGNLIHEFIQNVHDRLRAYGDEFGYEVEHAIESLGPIDVSRSSNDIQIRVGWEAEEMLYFEFGTSDHTIDGDPVLSFIWENPPGWIREEFDQGRDTGGRFVSGWRVFLPEVEVAGLPEARAVRDALNTLRRDLQ